MANSIHLRAPRNWINDPNGFIYYKGKYHMFYQYFPYGSRWGTMHWGHAVSENLINWVHKDIALHPSKVEDQNGCFSGSAIEWKDKLYLYYTGVRYEEVNPEDIHLCLNDRFVSSQLMITSEDGEQFDNFQGKKVVVPMINEEELGSKTHTRDPKVWRGTDAWYMILGSTNSNQKGEVLFYKSTDLENWIYVNRAVNEVFGWMCECPDYFKIEDAQVMLFSPMGVLKDGYAEENHALCALVDFTEENCELEISETYQFLDYGLDLYAPQSTLDQDGNRVVAAWARMPEPVDDKWIGMYCIPRIVKVKNNHIYFTPHPDAVEAFTKEVSQGQNIQKGCYRICLNLDNNENLEIGGYEITRRDDKIYTDRTKVYPKTKGLRVQFETPLITEGNSLDIYVDENFIEIYINEGEYVLSNVVYNLGKEIKTDIQNEWKIYTLD